MVSDSFYNPNEPGGDIRGKQATIEHIKETYPGSTVEIAPNGDIIKKDMLGNADGVWKSIV